MARQDLDRFLVASQRARSAQLEGLQGAGLRDAMLERRRTQGVLIQRIQSLLTGAGHGASPEAMRRVSDTLEALAAGIREDAAPGRLARDLQPPGFEALAELASRPPTSGGSAPPLDATGPPKAREEVPETPPDPAAEARASLAQAERTLETARREAREASGTQSVAERRAEGARGELEEATHRFERAKERAARSAVEEEEARKDAQDKAAALEAAEAARDAALRALRDLE
jgi:hypothetical protein